MTLADRTSVVALYIKELVENNKAALSVADVYYGDQTNIPRYPSVVIDPAPMNRELSGIGGKGRTDNIITVSLLVYNGNIKDVQNTRLITDQLAESLMDLLHEDITMNGLVIHGYVTAIEPGYLYRNNTLLRSSRVTWTGMTKTLIS